MCTSYHGMADDAREWSVFPLFQIFIRTVQKIFQTAGFHLVFTHIPEFHLHILRFFFPAGILRLTKPYTVQNPFPSHSGSRDYAPFLLR